MQININLRLEFVCTETVQLVVIQAFRIYSSHRAGLKPHYFVKWRARRGVLKEFRSKLIQKVYRSIIE